MSLNKCMIIGNLGRDPEMRYTPSGQAVTQFTVATNRRWQSNGEWQEETEWFRVVVWGQQAERTAERLRKGHKVYVEGRIQTREWTDKEGKPAKTTEIRADRIVLLGGGGGGEGRGGGGRSMATAGRERYGDDQTEHAPVDAPHDDDIPF